MAYRPRTVLIFSVLMALWSGWGCGARESGEPGRYVNRKDTFSIVLPTGWERMSQPVMSVTVGTKKGTVAIAVGLIKVGPLSTLEQFRDYFVSGYQNAGVTVVKQTDATLGGVSAHDILSDLNSGRVT